MKPLPSLPFRIRRRICGSEEEDAAASVEAERVYEEFLRKHRARILPDLWRYFRRDFFHDGRIDSIQHSPAFDEVRLRIWCPNIKRERGDDFDFVNALFEVTFSSVVLFRVEADGGACAEVRPEFLEYLSGEIDTVEGIADSPTVDGREPHSLIIDAGDAWLTVVFEDLRVCAVERLAFGLVCRDPRFTIPWSRE